MPERIPERTPCIRMPGIVRDEGSLVRETYLIAGVDSGLGSLHRERGGVHDPESVIPDFAIHDTHNLVYASRASMSDLEKSALSRRGHGRAHHLDQSSCGDLDGMEVVRTKSQLVHSGRLQFGGVRSASDRQTVLQERLTLSSKADRLPASSRLRASN